MSTIKEYLGSLVSYNVWANKRIKDYVNDAGDSMGTLLQKSSFPTIRETLIHILDAQYIWLERMKGNSIMGWPGKNFNGNTLEAAEMLVQNSTVWLDFIQTLPEHMLLNRIDYVNTKGDSFSNSVLHIVAHVMNHSTYHRGQIITLLRGAGYQTPGSTDLINYYRDSHL